MKRLIFGAALVMLGTGAAHAAPPPELPDPRVLLQGFLTEAQVSAAFEFLRNTLVAAAEGRAGVVPEIVQRELDRIDGDVKLRGTLAGLLLLKQLEAQIKALLAPALQAPELPPTAPYSRT